MGETPRHIQVMVDVFQVLKGRYKGADDVFLAANMFLYYEEGNPRQHVSPDVFLTEGVPKEKTPERRSYRTWEEGGKGPSVVFEITSESTSQEDREEKFRIYQDVLKVQEYFLFDPYGEYLNPPLIGYRLVRGKYVRIKPVKGRLPSKVLGLHLEADGADLRLYDPKTRQWLLTPVEQVEQARAEVERLRQELEALRRQQHG
jgi:Uma2 family endonuclease